LGSSAETPLFRMGGVTDPKIHAPPHSCCPAEFGPMSNGTSVIKEIRLKNLTSRVQPFKVTQGHRNRQESLSATCYYLLTFHSNHVP